MRTTLLLTLLVTLWTRPADAKLVTKEISYEHEGTKLVGYLAYDDKFDGPRPGVLVVHEWWGLNDYAKKRANMLAELGYVAFAADMYGSKVTEHPAEAREWATQIRSNVDSWRDRAVAGLNVLKGQEQVDKQRLAAIGYCFGGSTALQLAYTGEDLEAVVTFHAGLVVPTEEEAEQVQPSILVCHGASDAFIPAETIAQFQKALTAANVDWDMVYYGGAKHSFTVPGIDERGVDGLAYDKNADQRSWNHMQDFLKKQLGKR